MAPFDAFGFQAACPTIPVANVILREDAESPRRPIPEREARRSFPGVMRRRMIFTALALALLVLALLGWTVEAVRWATTGSRRPRLAPAS